MRRFFISIAVILTVTVTMLFWLGGRESTLHWLAQKVETASDGSVMMEGLSGSLLGTLHIKQIRYRSPERNITAEDVSLSWILRDLLRLRAGIQILSANAVTIENIDVSKKSPTLPETLAPPVSIRVDAANIATIAYISGAERIELHDIRFLLSSDRSSWEIEEFSFDSLFGKMEGDARLGAEKPFLLTGSLRLQHTEADASAKITGNLREILVDGEFKGFDSSGYLKATITPFDGFIVRALELRATDINPARIQRDWPEAQLGIEANIQVSADEILSGNLSIDNPEAGELDRGKIPLRSIHAQVNGTPEIVSLNDIVIDMAQAGKFTGKGQLTSEKVMLLLQTSRLNLQGIHSKMRATRITGDIALNGNKERKELVARLGQNRLRLDLKLIQMANQIQLHHVNLRADKGEMNLAGVLELDKVHSFSLGGKMRRFNLASLGEYPAADLNANLEMKGHLAPEWELALQYVFQPSRLWNQSLTGHGNFIVNAREARDVDIVFAVGPNNARFQGNFGKPGQRIQWRVNAPRLDALGKSFHGVLNGDGELAGSFDAFSLALRMEGSELQFPDGYAAKSFQANAVWGANPKDALEGNILINDAKISGMQWQTIQVGIKGTQSAHVVDMKMRNTVFDFNANAAGTWNPKSGWQGEISTLENQGKYKLKLMSPAPLLFGRDHFSLRDMVMQLNNGKITLQSLEKKGNRVQTSGSATGVSLAYLTALSPSLESHINGSLVLGAKWSFSTGDSVNGDIHVYRESGDLALDGFARTSLGLKTLDMRVNFVKNAAHLKADVDTEKVGSLQVDGNTQFLRSHDRWELTQRSPLQLSMKANVESLDWLGPLSGQPDMDISGSLLMNVNAIGTLGNPTFAGDISGNNLAARWASMGIALSNGELRAQLSKNQLQLQKLSFNGGDGTVNINGYAQLQNGQFDANFKILADKLLLLANPDRQLVISGNGNLALNDKRLELTGNWKADRARIELKEYNSVKFSEDVVVLGRETKKEERRRPLPVYLDMSLDFGPQFYIKGMGLEARLEGKLQITSAGDNKFIARGIIQAKEGIYNAYGQRLQIERGFLTFNGPINNPSIDILVVRKIENARLVGTERAVEAGILIRGTALSPNIKLVSTPEVPDAEKLSWLVLGQSGAQSTTEQNKSLLAAATGLLSANQAGQLQSQLSAIGIDEVGISNATDLEGAVLTIGKKISSRAFLTYEQGIAGAMNVVRLRVLLSDRISLRAQTGSSSAVELFYDWVFD